MSVESTGATSKHIFPNAMRKVEFYTDSNLSLTQASHKRLKLSSYSEKSGRGVTISFTAL